MHIDEEVIWHTLLTTIPLESTSSAFENPQRRFGLIAAMAVITSTSYFIGKQDRGQNWFSQHCRTNREISRRHDGVSRSGMVDKLEGIGNIDGVHDEGARYQRPSPALRLDAFVAEDVLHSRDLTSLSKPLRLFNRASTVTHRPDQRWPP